MDSDLAHYKVNGKMKIKHKIRPRINEKRLIRYDVTKIDNLNCRRSFRHQICELFRSNGANETDSLEEWWKKVRDIINNVWDIVIGKPRKTKRT